MKKSFLAAGILGVAVVGWFASGVMSADAPPEVAPRLEREAQPFLVQAVDSTARTIDKSLTLQGAAEPLRSVTLRPRITSNVAAILVREGERVTAGQVLVRLDVEMRDAAVERAEAMVAQSRADHEAAQTLQDRGAGTRADTRTRFAELQSAESELAEARIERANVEITAPFDGVLDRLDIEEGDRVSPEMADGIGTIIDVSQLIVRVDVPQQAIAAISAGRSAEITFISGETASGTVSFVSAAADENTRTFRTEIEIPNSDGKLMAGVSAEAIIPTGQVEAHFASPALLVLNDEGVLGVKVVDADGRAEFVPVTIVQSDTTGVWIAGLPDEARLITVGQGFVRPGEAVRVSVPEVAAAPGA